MCPVIGPIADWPIYELKIDQIATTPLYRIHMWDPMTDQLILVSLTVVLL